MKLYAVELMAGQNVTMFTLSLHTTLRSAVRWAHEVATTRTWDGYIFDPTLNVVVYDTEGFVHDDPDWNTSPHLPRFDGRWPAMMRRSGTVFRFVGGQAGPWSSWEADVERMESAEAVTS